MSSHTFKSHPLTALLLLWCAVGLTASGCAGVNNKNRKASDTRSTTDSGGGSSTTGTAVLSISDVGYSYGSVTTSSTSSKTFTVSNTGDGAATLGTVSTAGVGLAAPYSVTGGTCTTGASIAASGTCTVIVVFSPTGVGAASDTIDLSYNDGSASQTASRAISGTGAAPATQASLSFSPTSNDFGNIVVGNTVSQSFTISNTGLTGATAVYISIAGAGFTLANNTCGTAGSQITMAASTGSCTFDAQFAPGSTGAKSGTVSLSYHDGVATQSGSAAVSGTGIAAASISFSPTSKTFANTAVGASSAVQSFTVTNAAGGASATNVYLALTTNTQFVISSPTCGTSGAKITITAGSTCTFDLAFSPTSSGAKSDTLTITYDNGAATGQTATAAVDGTAFVPASISFSPTSKTFANTTVGASSTVQSFTVTNAAGSTSATNVYLALTTNTQFVISNPTCGTSGAKITIAGGATCTFDLAFSPTSSGAKSDTLTITYDNGAATSQTATAAVDGNGLTPASLALDGGSTYDYGSHASGSTTGHTFTLTNTGGTAATLGTITTAGLGLAAPFALNGGTCATGGTVAATTGSCTIIVDFSPTGGGAVSDQIDVSYHNGAASGQTTSRPIQGTGTSNIGAFTVTGITGGADAVADAWLTVGVNATVNWSNAAGESGYEVTIYEANGSTVKCAMQSVAADTLLKAFSSCALTDTTTYVARVIAKDGADSREAANSPYTFSTSGTISIPAIKVSADADDGAIFDLSSVMTSGEDGNGDGYMGDGASYRYWGYFRFALPSAIPPGVSVQSATLKIWGRGTWNWNSSSHRLRVWAHKSADAPQVDNGDDAPEGPAAGGTTLTTANVTWPSSGGLDWQAGQYNTTPDISALVQEVINTYSGMASGSHLQFWIGTPTAVTNAEVNYEDFASGVAARRATLTLVVGGQMAPSAFNIAGVGGGADTTADRSLPPSTQPKPYWESSFGASSYDVTIYQDDGTTIQCATINVPAGTPGVQMSAAFSGCTLTSGQHYRIKVSAKDSGGTTTTATNNGYRFEVMTPACGALANATTYNAAGTGTKNDPFLLCMPQQILDLSTHPAGWEKSYKMIGNIDMVDITADGGLRPIGRDGATWRLATPFYGDFDGNGYTITNFTYDNTGLTEYAIGLFGLVAGPGQIRNLTMTNAHIIASDDGESAGIAAGMLERGALIQNVRTAGLIYSEHTAGGVVGAVSRGSRVAESGSNASFDSPSIFQAFYGGVAGALYYGSVISNSYYTGSIDANGQSWRCGGIVWEASTESFIENSFASSDLSCMFAGGIVGCSWNDLTVKNSFATGAVEDGGQLADDGCNNASITFSNTYYDQDSACTGGGCDLYGLPNTLANLKAAAQEPQNDWDFSGVWHANAGTFPSHDIRPYDLAGNGGCAAHLGGSGFAGGQGSVSNPYLICDYTQLDNLAGNTALTYGPSAFKLMADIDMNAVSVANFPIGQDTNVFYGWFDGNGHTIANYHNTVTLTGDPGDNPALFEYLTGRITNLAVTDATVEGAWNSLSILVGGVGAGVIDNVIVTGETIGGGWASAAVAVDLYHGNIFNAYVDADLIGNAGHGVAGVAAVVREPWNNSQPIIKNVVFVGNISDSGGGSDGAGPIMLWGGPSDGDAILLNTYYASDKTCFPTCITHGATGIDTSVATGVPSWFFNPANAPLSSWDFNGIWDSFYPGARPDLH